MAGYAECAAQRGANLILFPEAALCGYELDTEHSGEDQMHCRLAEPIPGPASYAMAEVAKENNIYIVFGLSERGDDGKVYNSAAVISPRGILGKYRKMHLNPADKIWAAHGEEPFMFDTEWGKFGIAICYDTYVFPELMRYYAANGCRLHLNPCAVNTIVTARNIREAIEYLSVNNAIFIASANCVGRYKTDKFVGGSNVIGPGKNAPEPHYYVGNAPGTPGSDEQKMIWHIDLTYVNKSWHYDWGRKQPDFVRIYVKLYAEVAAWPCYQNKKSLGFLHSPCLKPL